MKVYFFLGAAVSSPSLSMFSFSDILLTLNSVAESCI
jgi:hypothetical protein